MEKTIEFVSAVVSDRGLSEKRPYNEDSYLELPESGIFAVADGVGGAQAGDVASQMAIEILAEAFTNRSPGMDAEETMRLAIERANSAIFQMATDLPQLSSMATTIVALHISGDVATIGHVGDSRLYRVLPDGRLSRETNDHSVVEEEVRAGRMSAEQALNHPSRNVISRALGAESTVDIDLKTIMVEPGTTFLLCSDGITRHINDEELGKVVRFEKPQAACSTLKEICFDRGAEDNLTAVVVRIPAPAAQSFAAAAAPAGISTETEIDEPTISTARSPFDSPAAPEEDLTKDLAEHFDSTFGSEEQDGDDSDSLLILDPEEEFGVDTVGPEGNGSYSSSSVVVPAREVPAPAPVPSAAAHIPRRETAPAITSDGMASKVLPAIAFLVLGVILGMAGYYFLLRPAAPPPQVVEVPVITEMKSSNTALTAFEEGRRQVDADPARYLTANAASPQDAEDYFLLGRAFMLTGKYWEAKRAFTEAKNRLAAVDQNNAKTLASEIALAQAIIQSPSATESFAREIAAGSGNEQDANSAAPATQPFP